VPYVTSGQSYATRADLANVVAAAALAHPSTGPAAQDAKLLAASEEIDGYLRNQYVLPLTKWGSDLVQRCCEIAAYRLMVLRGFNPEVDGLYLTNYEQAVSWLKRVADGHVSPDVIDSSPGDQAPGDHAPEASPTVVSPNTPRGTCRR
jgi:phage gp36-like protein